MPELEIIMKKYPNAILTLNSAFYYYGLTDTIPDHYYVATPKSNRKIEDVRVKQIYENSNAFEMGKTTIEYDGVDITICKDPFFYRCDGGLCFDYLKACEEKYRTNVTESIEEK